MVMLEVAAVPVLRDNYVWLIYDSASEETIAVDPSVADPVLAAAAQRGWPITQVWNTHWHPDHTGGNDAIREATGCTITGPAEVEKVSKMDRVVAGGDRVRIGEHEAVVIDIPAHTAGHIAFHFETDGMVFVGDTLFAMGCGRLFEGTAEQMFSNLKRLAELPGETRVFCGHEYTLANARFAIEAEPGNRDIAERLSQVAAMRDRGETTLPTTIAEERATNPFMRAPDAREFARLRTMKDSFG
jgi:hydroxyacylglutathione hydrolase